MKIIVDVNLAVRWANMLSEKGTIVTIDPNKARLHILPFAITDSK